MFLGRGADAAERFQVDSFSVSEAHLFLWRAQRQHLRDGGHTGQTSEFSMSGENLRYTYEFSMRCGVEDAATGQNERSSGSRSRQRHAAAAQSLGAQEKKGPIFLPLYLLD